jgi:hypothetical protein
MPIKFAIVEKKTQAGTVHKVEIGPYSLDLPIVISFISAIFALIALGRSFSADRRSKKLEKHSRFENDYGTYLRTTLREFEPKILNLRSFLIPSSRTLRKKKSELAKETAEIETSILQLEVVLREIDSSKNIKSSNWMGSFSNKVGPGLKKLEDAQDANTSADQMIIIQEAQSLMQEGISAVRVLLDRQRRPV